MPEQTLKQYSEAVLLCKDIFVQKMNDYGSAWRILRVSSITDQIFIKAQRIRSIEEKGAQMVEDGIKSEYIGIVNYAVIALIQLQLGEEGEIDMDANKVESLFEKEVNQAKSLMQKKNHDYDEAWREMRVSSLTDLILMKLLRIKQIEDNEGKTLISEGIDANYYDIINYAVFALIKLHEA
ncbi:MAG: DUF1599 domain-containing protein [Bacteroidia bacterium]|nr:DUF1599 domain-containing protein [Bacteroidia bacterium]